jgi:16S rRNA (guanine527-N7)-methyltransferase
MTEAEARAWIAARYDPARLDRLARFASKVAEETLNQNLIAASTIDTIWQRHVLDSAQLVPMVEQAGEGDWIDIGAGAGFPGIVAAILTDRRVVLVEPRAKRAMLLNDIADMLALSNVVVHQSKIERLDVTMPAAIISARAVARLGAIFSIGHRHADADTIWVLPKGRSADDEVSEARVEWHGTFHVEQSITDPTSSIVIAQGVRRK